MCVRDEVIRKNHRALREGYAARFPPKIEFATGCFQEPAEGKITKSNSEKPFRNMECECVQKLRE